MILRKIIDSLAETNVKSLFVAKEQYAPATSKLHDYAAGREYDAGTNIDQSLAYAIQVTGDATAGLDFVDANSVAMGITIGAGEGFLAFAIANNFFNAQAGEDNYIYLGNNNGKNTILFGDPAGAGASFGNQPVNISNTLLTGATALVIGYDRDANLLHKFVVDSTGTFSVSNESASTPWSGELTLGGSAASGVSIYGGTTATNPAGLYMMGIAIFKGSLPDYHNDTSLQSELIQWRADALTGNKYVPSHILAL